MSKECSKCKLKVEKKTELRHYLMSVGLELLGISVCTVGLFEIVVINKTNPANVLITGGSLFIALGSFYFAKVVKWKK